MKACSPDHPSFIPHFPLGGIIANDDITQRHRASVLLWNPKRGRLAHPERSFTLLAVGDPGSCCVKCIDAYR